jgi:WD repeat-containing protein 19
MVTADVRAQQPLKAGQQLLALGRYTEALACATLANDSGLWRQLCAATVEGLDIPTAVHAHRASGQAGTARVLASFQFEEDRRLLGGHVALLRGNIDKAQELFLSSSKPIEALNMHRDLLNWQVALQLAGRFAPEQIPYISREYAQQLEMQCVPKRKGKGL